MSEKSTAEELLELAKESLRAGLSISPIGGPRTSETDTAITHFDEAVTIAGRALYKTDRQKSNEEKATAMVISALVSWRLGCNNRAADEFEQAKELIGDSFVYTLIMDLTGQSTNVTLPISRL